MQRTNFFLLLENEDDVSQMVQFPFTSVLSSMRRPLANPRDLESGKGIIKSETKYLEMLRSKTVTFLST